MTSTPFWGLVVRIFSFLENPIFFKFVYTNLTMGITPQDPDSISEIIEFHFAFYSNCRYPVNISYQNSTSCQVNI